MISARPARFSLVPKFSQVLCILLDLFWIITFSWTSPDPHLDEAPCSDSLRILYFSFVALIPSLMTYLFVWLFMSWSSPPSYQKPKKDSQRLFLCCLLLCDRYINIFVEPPNIRWMNKWKKQCLGSCQLLMSEKEPASTDHLFNRSDAVRALS